MKDREKAGQGGSNFSKENLEETLSPSPSTAPKTAVIQPLSLYHALHDRRQALLLRALQQKVRVSVLGYLHVT